MINFSKKTILIIVLAITVVVLAVFFALFLLNYLAKQEEIKTQTKINNDIALVQDLIVNKKFAQLDPAVLKNQGLAQPALDLAQQAVMVEEQRITAETQSVEANKFENKVRAVLNSYDPYDPIGNRQIPEKLLALGDNVIADLERQSYLADSGLRFEAYRSLGILANNDLELQKQILPIIERGSKDSELIIKMSLSAVLLGWGQKQGFPNLIEALDPKYRSFSMLSEPLMSLPEYAHSMLVRYSIWDFGMDKGAWQKWWDENQNNLKWDNSIQEFHY